PGEIGRQNRRRNADRHGKPPFRRGLSAGFSCPPQGATARKSGSSRSGRAVFRAAPEAPIIIGRVGARGRATAKNRFSRGPAETSLGFSSASGGAPERAARSPA